MKIIDNNTLRTIFLDMLDDAKYNLIQENHNEVSAIHFGTGDTRDHIFLEYGYYNEAIAQVPNTEEELITPGIFAYDGADIVNNPNYDCYNVMVALEFLGFESQRDAMRLLLERYATDLRGKSIDVYEKDGVYTWGDNADTTGNKYTCLISTEMPVLSETIEQSGYERFQAYINLDFTVLAGIIVANEDELTIDGETLSLTSFIISRDKSIKQYNVKSLERASYAESQTITFSISGMYNANKEASKKIKKAILTKDYMNTPFELAYAGYTYRMYMQKGEMNVSPNSPVTFTAIFSTLKEI